jgi:hypothetical protein
MIKSKILVGSAILLSLAIVGLKPVVAETDSTIAQGDLIAQTNQMTTIKEIAGQVISIEQDVVKLKTQSGEDVKLKIARSLREQLGLKVGDKIIATLTGAQEGELWVVSDINYENASTTSTAMTAKKVMGEVLGIEGEVVTVKLDSGEVVKLKVPSSWQTQLSLKTGSKIVANLTGAQDGDLWLISDLAYQNGVSGNVATDSSTTVTGDSSTTVTDSSTTVTGDSSTTVTNTSTTTMTESVNTTPTTTTTGPTTTTTVEKRAVRALW